MRYKSLTKKNLKLELIKRFVENNNRVPFDFEINDLLKEYFSNNLFSYESGLYTGPKEIEVLSNISATQLNNSFNDLLFNFKNILSNIESVSNTLFKKHSDLINYLQPIENYLKKSNLQATQLLFKKDYSNNLLYTYFEDFKSLSTVVFPDTTCSVSQGGAYSSIKEIETISNIQSVKGYIYGNAIHNNISITGDINSLLNEDGNYYSINISSSNKDTINYYLELTLQEKTYVNLLKFSGEFNSLESIYIYISVDKNNWTLVESNSNISNTISIPVNKELQYIRISLTKTEYDSFNETNGSYNYSFKFDSISIYNNDFNSRSILIAGPYSFYDELDELVPFNYIQLEVCETIRNNSYINYYISTNQTDWIPISPNKKNIGSSLIFLNSNTSDFLSINNAINNNRLDYQNVNGLSLEANQSLLNIKIPIEQKELLNPLNFKIKRNIKSTEEVFDTPSGWFLITQDDKYFYKTTIEIDNLEGLTLDVGPNVLLLNGVAVSGTVLIPYGVNQISINSSNFIELPSGMTSEKDFMVNDPLYPYNQKALIEGYNYPSSFVGAKTYLGISNFHGYTLKYLEYKDFLNKNSLDTFTIITDSEYIYVVVNTNKNYSDWINEVYDIYIPIVNQEITSVYFKAEFLTENLLDSSTLHNFTLKVG